MAQQSAVDWLVEQLIKRDKDFNPSSFAIQIYFESSRNIVEQAKQTEKEQIVNARESGKWEITKCINDPNYTFQTSEQYYNETYGK